MHSNGKADSAPVASDNAIGMADERHGNGSVKLTSRPVAQQGSTRFPATDGTGGTGDDLLSVADKDARLNTRPSGTHEPIAHR